jgi:hypothetical protein
MYYDGSRHVEGGFKRYANGDELNLEQEKIIKGNEILDDIEDYSYYDYLSSEEFEDKLAKKYHAIQQQKKRAAEIEETIRRKKANGEEITIWDEIPF